MGNLDKGIYGILIGCAQKYYIGSSECISKHWSRDHLPKLRRGEHHNHNLQTAFNECGEDNVFLIDIESVEDNEMLPERERYWICAYLKAGLALNLKRSGTPGMRGKRHSMESRRKMSLMKRKREGWAFVSPDGGIFRPNILSEFCRENNLNSGAMCLVGANKLDSHKGWRNLYV